MSGLQEHLDAIQTALQTGTFEAALRSTFLIKKAQLVNLLVAFLARTHSSGLDKSEIAGSKMRPGQQSVPGASQLSINH